MFGLFFTRRTMEIILYQLWMTLRRIKWVSYIFFPLRHFFTGSPIFSFPNLCRDMAKNIILCFHPCLRQQSMGWSKLKCSSCKVRVVRTRRRRVESTQGLATCWYHRYLYSPSFITIGNCEWVLQRNICYMIWYCTCIYIYIYIFYIY